MSSTCAGTTTRHIVQHKDHVSKSVATGEYDSIDEKEQQLCQPVVASITESSMQAVVGGKHVYAAVDRKNRKKAHSGETFEGRSFIQLIGIENFCTVEHQL